MLCLLTILSDKLLPIRDEIAHHRQSICDACAMKCLFWKGNATRPSPWMKIKALQESLYQCRQIMWIDADATPLAMFRFPKTHTDIVAVHDQNGLNTGIMILHNTTWVHETLRVVWNRDEFMHHPWWEQEALRRSIHDGMIRDTSRIRLSRDLSQRFHHISGCFSTQPARICRRGY